MQTNGSFAMSSAKSSVRANSIFPSRTGGSDSASAVAISSSALIPSRTAADARSIAILLLEKRTAAPAFVRGSRRIIAMNLAAIDRKSVVEVKGVSVHVDLGGSLIIKKKTKYKEET